jgi:hypothetical protein
VRPEGNWWLLQMRIMRTKPTVCALIYDMDAAVEARPVAA